MTLEESITQYGYDVWLSMAHDPKTPKLRVRRIWAKTAAFTIYECEEYSSSSAIHVKSDIESPNKNFVLYQGDDV